MRPNPHIRSPPKRLEPSCSTPPAPNTTNTFAELNLPPLDAVGKDGCLEHSILNIERMYGRMPDNYFEVLACLMKD